MGGVLRCWWDEADTRRERLMLTGSLGRRIVCWIGTSMSVILQNKWILSGLGFSHPIVRACFGSRSAPLIFLS